MNKEEREIKKEGRGRERKKLRVRYHREIGRRVKTTDMFKK